MASDFFGLAYCLILTGLLMIAQIEVHERAHLALSRGTLRRKNIRQCAPTSGFKRLSVLRQTVIYAAGITANALVGVTCFFLSELLTAPDFWRRWTAVALNFGAAESVGMVVANLLPLSTDGRILCVLLLGLFRGKRPDLDLVSQPTGFQKTAASILGGCVGFAFIAWRTLH